jgi:hypothetical protein
MLRYIAEESRSERNVPVPKGANGILNASNLFSIRCPDTVYCCKENLFAFKNEVLHNVTPCSFIGG